MHGALVRYDFGGADHANQWAISGDVQPLLRISREDCVCKTAVARRDFNRSTTRAGWCGVAAERVPPRASLVQPFVWR